MSTKAGEQFDQNATPEAIDLYRAISAATQRRTRILGNKKYEQELLKNAVQSDDVEFLKEALKHCVDHQLHIILMVVESLRDNGSYTAQAGNLQEGQFEAARLVVEAVVASINRDGFTHTTNDELNKTSRYAVQNTDDASLIATLMRERKIVNHDELLGLVAEIKRNQSPVLSDGVL